MVGRSSRSPALTGHTDDWTRFQMVSLLKLAKVTEEGVRFLSPHDGTPMYADYFWSGYKPI